ncbi:hypothetical protein NX801_24445 [Streptomyces sp. LP05-1]|uniref:Uncharacterized protein n=1 Tax=Streptomyces pyxinae TaxID=2970734 RepID=A0ABT2CMU2_9ACTN|nr:hypothetical protein [Streptomyces sp. LP05-1]MCS0638748.1 hypothetical protein [Streptomyces sp. LP05-1]
MKHMAVSAHIEPDTHYEVTPFPGPNSFVSLRVGDGLLALALIAPAGSADALRALATAATEAAGTLDALTIRDGSEVTGRD